MIFSNSIALRTDLDVYSSLIFKHLQQQRPTKAQPWMSASRMSYGVTSVRPLSPLSIVNIVTYIYVKPVWGNISLINPKITT